MLKICFLVELTNCLNIGHLGSCVCVRVCVGGGERCFNACSGNVMYCMKEEEIMKICHTRFPIVVLINEM